jgi:hypothetical protein
MWFGPGHDVDRGNDLVGDPAGFFPGDDLSIGGSVNSGLAIFVRK